MSHKSLPVSMTPSEAQWGIRYLLFQYFFLPGLLALGLRLSFPYLPGVYLDFAYFLVNFLVVICLFRHFLLDSARHTAEHFPNFFTCAIIGFLVYEVLILLVSFGILQLFPDFFNVNDASISEIAKENLPVMAVGTVLLVPLVEETLYRGVVFGLLRRKGRVTAYVVSTFVFCAIHVAGYWGSFEPLHLILCFIQYIPAGVVLAAVYELSGSIFAPVLIHMAVNAIGIFS